MAPLSPAASRHGPDHDTIHTAYALNRAAIFRQEQGAPATAIPALERALSTHERLFGNDHPDDTALRTAVTAAFRTAPAGPAGWGALGIPPRPSARRPPP